MGRIDSAKSALSEAANDTIPIPEALAFRHAAGIRIPEAAIAGRCAFSPRTVGHRTLRVGKLLADNVSVSAEPISVFFRRRVFSLLPPLVDLCREKRPEQFIFVRWRASLKTLLDSWPRSRPPVVSETTNHLIDKAQGVGIEMAHGKPRMGLGNVAPQPLLEVTNG